MATATYLDRSHASGTPPTRHSCCCAPCSRSAPILFGLDKFANVMTDWPIVPGPWIDGILPGDAATAMYIVGVIEIVAGILVAVAPRIGAYVVALWLAGIIVNLLTLPGFTMSHFVDFAAVHTTSMRMASLDDSAASTHALDTVTSAAICVAVDVRIDLSDGSH